MRVIAVAILVALLLPTAATATLGALGSCCCTIGPGATCPMKRSAAKCDSSDAPSCGIQRSESRPSQLPVIGIHRATVPTQVGIADVPFLAVRFDPGLSLFATRARRAPDAPPPRHA